MPNICVFCGAREGNHPSYVEAAIRLGREMASREWGLVYGGAKIGMMGAIAGAVLDGGGRVKGVIPEVLDWPEARWDRVNDMQVVPDLFVRKSVMMRRSDAFVALPGGVGTLDEIFELAAAKQLKMDEAHGKPLFILNVAGYFDPLREMIRNAVGRGFWKLEDSKNIQVVDDVAELVAELVEAFSGRAQGLQDRR